MIPRARSAGPRSEPYPEGMALVDVLFEGYLGRPDHRVASTVGLIRDTGAIVVVDPGLVPGPSSILDPLAALGLGPADVTDVVFSHHHPDHTLNAATSLGPRRSEEHTSELQSPV